jgi:hypothetical protein
MNEKIKEFQKYLSEQPENSDIHEFVMRDIAGFTPEEKPHIATFSDKITLGILVFGLERLSSCGLWIGWTRIGMGGSWTRRRSGLSLCMI